MCKILVHCNLKSGERKRLVFKLENIFFYYNPKITLSIFIFRKKCGTIDQNPDVKLLVTANTSGSNPR